MNEHTCGHEQRSNSYSDRSGKGRVYLIIVDLRKQLALAAGKRLMSGHTAKVIHTATVNHPKLT